ncbi:hypothetical protein [Lactiplantibacillus pentosus]|uniref:3',5'-cyclic-nucleotide phosphodiesterase n=1 Tax=Lactiplantibacillus pentosus TaxID=1589 RepID=A0AAX6LE54_LACPE|nr:hypothetical protein [Lactiplantibacillus pentosus]MDF2312808.1 hypothetical protein [Lactiplantibacillus pentosus]
MRPLQVVQISDLHLTPRGQVPVHGQQYDPWAKLANIIEDIRQLPTITNITGFDRLYRRLDS